MFDHKKKKSIWIGVVTVVLLTVILIVFLRHLDENIFQLLSETKPLMIFVLLICCCLYILCDSLIYHAAYRGRGRSFSFSDGVDLTSLQNFGKTAFIAGGGIPLQSFYLFKKGIMPGQSVGMTAFLYITQKTAVLLYAAVLLCFRWNWVAEVFPSAEGYLIFSSSFCAVIIAVLILLCTSRKICHFACWLIDRLPSTGKWPGRKEKLNRQICMLYEETHTLFRKRKKVVSIMLLNFLKLLTHFTIPFAVIRMLGMRSCTFLDVQTLAAVMLLLSNALPNVAGMGSVEFSFMLAFSEVFGAYTAAAMIYYRCATYYFPFVLSIFKVFLIQKRMVFAAHESGAEVPSGPEPDRH